MPPPVPMPTGMNGVNGMGAMPFDGGMFPGVAFDGLVPPGGERRRRRRS